MLKKLVATAGLVAGLAVLAPTAAHADTYGIANVNPGSTFCIQNSAPVYSFARGEGLVLSGHNVRFTLSRYGAVVADSGVPVSAWAAESHVPGQYSVCAINQSLKPSTVRLQVSGS